MMKRDKGKRKIAAAALCLALAAGMTGCVKVTEKAELGKETSVQESEWEKEEPVTSKEPEKKEPEEPKEPEENGAEDVKEPEENGAEDGTEPEKEGQAFNASQGTERLSGKIQNPQEDGMTLLQTTLIDDDGMVTILEEKDAKKIPVKFTTDTRVEHWVIQGGGADIDMKEISFSDLKEGTGVELEGDFEGDTFIATRVIMEEYT